MNRFLAVLLLLVAVPFGLTGLQGRSADVAPRDPGTIDAVIEPPYQIGDLHFFDARTGWVAIGSIKTKVWRLLETGNGGKTWRQRFSFPAPRVARAHGQILPAVDIQFVDKRVGFLFFRYGNRYSLVRTTDGGASWQALKPPPSAPQPFRQLEFVNARDGWTVSEIYEGMGNCAVADYRTTDGARTWRKLPVQTCADSIDFSSPRDGWILDSNTAAGIADDLRTSDGGLHWHFCRTPEGPRFPGCGPPIPHMNVGKGPSSGYFLMFPTAQAYFFGRLGLMPMTISVQRGIGLHYSYWMYRLNRSDEAWVAPMRLPLRMPNFSSKSNPGAKPVWPPVVAVATPRSWYFADPWYFSFTLDGGKDWTYRSAPHRSVLWQPRGIWFFGTRSGYLLSDTPLTGGMMASQLYKTYNGGRSWHVVPLPGAK